jgi:hypothetical protein
MARPRPERRQVATSVGAAWTLDSCAYQRSASLGFSREEIAKRELEEKREENSK